MKNAIFNRLYLIIFFASILSMVFFALGATAETQAVKNTYLLFIFFFELLVIFSIGFILLLKKY